MIIQLLQLRILSNTQLWKKLFVEQNTRETHEFFLQPLIIAAIDIKI